MKEGQIKMERANSSYKSIIEVKVQDTENGRVFYAYVSTLPNISLVGKELERLGYKDVQILSLKEIPFKIF
jgi:hypothetical protein